MTNRELKQKVRAFQKEFNVTDYGSFKKAADKQGYTVVEFNHILNSDAVQSLIDSLKITDNILSSKGFTYADQNYRLIFIHEDLSEAEKRYVLAHETGHIYLGHMSDTPIIGKDVRDEYEANEFSHFLLNPTSGSKALAALKSRRKSVIGVALLIVTVIAGVLIFSKANNEKQDYAEYYVTTSGSKYHEKDCIFVKNKDNLHRLSKEEFESGGYEPCQICLP